MTDPSRAARLVGCTTRLAACATDDVGLMLELLGWRATLPILKRLIPLSRLAKMMWSNEGAGVGFTERQLRMFHVTEMVSRGGRVLVSSNCLERSLVLYRLFSRAGANPRLVLGTVVQQSAVCGHAWVEVDGEPVGEPDRARYTAVMTLGERGHMDPDQRVHVPA
jgi:hypothetical protein